MGAADLGTARRVFDIDISTWPWVIGEVTDPDVISTILDHLRSRAESRAPPASAASHLPDLPSTAG